ncbi:amidohydrolase family protein [Algoriphagus pacificus]|uniref:Amidohydrolase family protein n=1 Tax=Algoriphagus pacificus TaxID=2811234 RepID=A0ABS3CFR0_9BACT|nr:amidohydrolase family protein [Algoriphagus pacificus]MBN7815867.1 amidohydrolase family protein [Algoriphagus pacificus]
MRLDAHQHFWKYNPKKHEWINDDMKVIQKNFLPDDLLPLLSEHQIDGCVAVQADESFHETAFLIDLADEYQEIKAVVGWADLASDDLDKDLDQFSSHSKLKGYREVLQSKPVEYMLRKEFIRGIEKIGKRGYAYDILIFHNQLEATLKFLKSSPEQAFVIDHLAKPNIKLGIWREWKKELALIAERDYVSCKISGMVTEANWKDWTKEDFQQYMEIALELFGPKRLMFGSDWPVCLVAGAYEQVFDLVERFTDTLSPTEKNQILGKNAADFYGIKE